MSRRIEAAPVERNEHGEWWHPELPPFDEGDGEKYQAWLKEQGLEVAFDLLEYVDDEHPAYVSYYERGEGFLAWESAAPDGEGWFTLAIADTEDGPTWVWVRAADAAETRDAKGGI